MTNGKPEPSKLPTPPKLRRQPMSAHEEWYLSCLRVLTNHYRRPPSLTELSSYIGRAINPIYTALRRLEAKGYVRRNKARKFEIVEPEIAS